MYQRIFVPVDGSSRSYDVADAAAGLAERWDCPLEIVTVVRSDGVRAETAERMAAHMQAAPWAERATANVVVAGDDSVGAHIGVLVNAEPGSLVVMAGTGHGRSAALLGSTADDILACTTTPVLLYGPRADTAMPQGASLLVAVDGSDFAEEALGLAGAWTVALDLVPWVVSVVAPDSGAPRDLVGTALPHNVAERLRPLVGREVQFETLRSQQPGEALADFASSVEAALIVEAGHARKGMDRLLHGSVAMATVRHSSGPVLVMHGVAPAQRA